VGVLLLLVALGAALLIAAAIGLRALGEVLLSASAEGKPQLHLSGKPASSAGKAVKAAAVPAVSNPAAAAANRDPNRVLGAACLGPLCSLNTDGSPSCECTRQHNDGAFSSCMGPCMGPC
jgi:hypothetical protein